MKETQTAMKVGLTLAQRRDDSTDVGPTLDQPALLSGNTPTAYVFILIHATNTNAIILDYNYQLFWRTMSWIFT